MADGSSGGVLTKILLWPPPLLLQRIILSCCSIHNLFGGIFVGIVIRQDVLFQNGHLAG